MLCVASLGIAAILLNGGCTTHFRFKIPINLHETSTCSISKNSMEADLLRQTSLIIIDEITMQHRHAAEAIDRLMQDVRGSDKLFAGVTVVFGGDFQQILPVIIKGSRPQIVGCIQRSRFWDNLLILNLTINEHLGNDPVEREFARWQLDVGHGLHTDADGNIPIPPRFHCPQNTVDSLIETVYPGISGPQAALPNDQYFAERSILSARNDDVDELNKRILDAFPGRERVYHSADSIRENREDAEMMYPAEYLNSINVSGLPLSKLSLKVGCPVMVLRNLNSQEGVCNGTRGIVTRMANRDWRSGFWVAPMQDV